MTTDSVTRLPLRQRAPNLLDDLLVCATAGFNACVKQGSFDPSAARVMQGFLSAGAIALRCNGMDGDADAFLQAAGALDSDWRTFEPTMRRLIKGYGGAGE